MTLAVGEVAFNSEICLEVFGEVPGRAWVYWGPWQHQKQFWSWLFYWFLGRLQQPVSQALFPDMASYHEDYVVLVFLVLFFVFILCLFCLYIYVLPSYSALQGQRKKVLYFLELVVETVMRLREMNPGPLWEQPELLTSEPSLSHVLSPFNSTLKEM